MTDDISALEILDKQAKDTVSVAVNHNCWARLANCMTVINKLK